MSELAGNFVSLIAPMTDDMSTISEVRLARLVRRLMQDGAEGFLIGGDAAEFATLTVSERKMMVEIVMRESSNSLPVLVNATAISSMMALDIAQHGGRHGARGVVLMPPYYGKYTIPEVHQHFKTISHFCHLPMVAIDLPGVPANDMWDELRHNPSILIGLTPKSDPVNPYPTTDDFEVGPVRVSPLGLVDSQYLKGADNPIRPKLLELMRTHGVSRVAKAILDARDQMMGPPRVPQQPLPRSAIEAFI